ncbi:hypothetical protein EU546_03495 [Candidatus Thorarchaeota archaeon]|nr:MAG: hypothetical protein EU546_03495 [Candidatus Thorarchaeota archaeon]
MGQLSAIKSAISGKNPDGSSAGVVGRLAGIGSFFGIGAAILGFLVGLPLVPITASPWEVIDPTPGESFVWQIHGSPLYPVFTLAFMLLLGAGLFFQAIGSKKLREALASSYASVIWITFLFAMAGGIYALIGFEGVFGESTIPGFLSNLYLIGAVFALTWQLGSIIYADSVKSWVGVLAGILNGLFIPLLALGQVLGAAAVYGAYAVLLLGQIFTLLFWWGPERSIREFARSPDQAKFAFGLTGLLTFIIGAAAVFIGPLTLIEGVQLWRPWGSMLGGTPPIEYVTSPALVFAFLSMLVFWIMLAPRLGAKELKEAHIGEDLLKGGTKWFALFLAMMGLLATAQAGSFSEGAATWGFFLVTMPAGAMIVVGAQYCAKTDIVTGLPLVATAIFMMIAPYTLAPFVIYPFIIVIITQAFLMIESYIRGLTGFSQGALTVITSLVCSAMVILFLFGSFGSGPLALWPTTKWFNITLFAGVPPAIQTPTVIVLPILFLLLRNVSLSGDSHGRGYATGGILMGASVLFSLMIPVIEGNVTATHVANTGAALLLALYSISVVLVLSLNLSLANDVEDSGYEFEGTLIRIGTLVGLAFAAVMVILVLVNFSGLPGPEEIAFTVSMMVTFVVGTEILSLLGWLISGIRLGMLKEGFSFTRTSQ